MTYRPVAMTLSLAGLLQVLTGCKCPEPYTGDRTLERYPTAEDLEGLLDEDGQLTEEGCEVLCSSQDDGEIDRVDGCTLERDPPSDTTDDVATATEPTGDTGLVFAPTGERVSFVLTCEVYGTFTQECVGGRDHAAIASASTGVASTPVLAWLLGTAHAEAASVKSFVSLGAELEALDAPAELVEACRSAALDEVAHARIIGALARTRGGTPSPPRFTDVPERALFDVALENAVEGCVWEVWAAALAHWQATHATDDGIRRAMAPIARDEARHGDLARAIHAWAMPRLSDAEQRRIQQAQEQAVAELLESLEANPRAELASLGLPSAREAQALARGMAEVLWPVAVALRPSRGHPL